MKANKYYAPIPFFKTAAGGCIIRWKLSWLDRLRVAFTGNIWQEAQTKYYNLPPMKFFARCPVTAFDVKHGLAPGVNVIMSSRQMLDEVGMAEIGRIIRGTGGGFKIQGWGGQYPYCRRAS